MGKKSSWYNIFFRDEASGVWVGYNAVSGAFLEFDEEALRIAKQLLEHPPDPPSGREEEICAALTAAGFFVSQGTRELDLLRARRLDWVNRPDAFLTIALTERCNFSCPYCFGKKGPGSMNRQVKRRLVRFVERHAENWRSLAIDWYGGEPLLALDLLASLDEAIGRICARHQCVYRSSISTNGFLLTPGVCERLARTSVAALRVCLDGPPSVHDRYRPLKDGGPTFAAIVDNLLRAVSHFRVKLRINVDKGNADSLSQLLELLAAAGLRQEYLTVEIKPIVSSRLRPRENLAFKPWEFACVEPGMKLMIMDAGFTPANLPEKRGAHCLVLSPRQFMIDWRGLLYKCADTFSPEEAVGRLGAGGEGFMDHVRQQRWLDFPPDFDAECRSCQALPWCMGGCNFKRYVTRRDWCAPERYNLKEYARFQWLLSKTCRNNQDKGSAPTITV